MSEILQASNQLLKKSGHATEQVVIGQRQALLFESDTVLGFIFAYASVADLTECWESDSNNAISTFQFGLRKSGMKAWNTYLILLTPELPDYGGTASLSAIEEDLSGTRKVARAGIQAAEDLGAALLPLRRLQSAPRLAAIDMKKEIRERTTELPNRAVDAFLSDADESVLLQVLEESS